MKADRSIATIALSLAIVAGSSFGVAAQSRSTSEYDPLSSIRAPWGTADPTVPVVFEGRWPYGKPIIDETSLDVDGITRNRGGVWQATLRGMSDLRMDGVLTSSADMDIHPPGDSDGPGVFVFNERIRIENGGGSWVARPHVGFFIPDFTTGNAMADWQIVLTGEGGYSGLTAMAWIAHHEAGEDRWLDVDGVIFEGTPPV